MQLAEPEVRAAIAGAMTMMFLAALETTIVSTALPTIAADLGDVHLLSWVVTSYLLTSTCSTPIAGKLGDLYGRRRMLHVALAVFLVASVLCALSTTMLELALARALQGAGGGALITSAQTAVADVVAPRERGRYSVYLSIVWGASSLIGPTLGGILAQNPGWPSISGSTCRSVSPPSSTPTERSGACRSMAARHRSISPASCCWRPARC